MRILLIYRDAAWVRTHVLPAFNALPARVLAVDVRARNGLDSVSKVRSLLRQREPFDLIFLLEPNDVEVSHLDIAEARTNGSFVIAHLVDVPQDWWRSVKVSRASDLVLVAQNSKHDRLTSDPRRVIFFPFAVSEEFLSSARKLDVPGSNGLFIGSAHSLWRSYFVTNLAKMNLPVRVVGSGWTNKQSASPQSTPSLLLTTTNNIVKYPVTDLLERALHGGAIDLISGVAAKLRAPKLPNGGSVQIVGELSDRALADEIGRSAFILSTAVHGSSFLFGKPKKQFKLRDIEMPCFGVPYIVDRTADAIQCYPQGYPYSYAKLAELPSIIHRIHSNRVEADAVAAGLRSHITRFHTWRSRFKYLSEVGIVPSQLRDLFSQAARMQRDI